MTQKAREARKGKIKKEEGTRLSDLRKVLTRNCEPHTQGQHICRKGRGKKVESASRHRHHLRKSIRHVSEKTNELRKSNETKEDQEEGDDETHEDRLQRLSETRKAFVRKMTRARVQLKTSPN